MGIWGPGLYQNDLAKDIRDAYVDQLKRKKIGTEITSELINCNNDILRDSDEAPIFWFALADTQWELGRLEDAVKERALFHLEEGYDLRRWKDENSSFARERKKVLDGLKEKLLTRQPPEKKITQYKLYQCEWKRGDVYAYPLDSEYAKEMNVSGRYFLFHKIGETIYWPGHVIPIVRVKISKSDNIPSNVEEFNNLEYVQTAVTKCDGSYSHMRGKCYVDGMITDEYLTDKFGYMPEYRLKLINTSKRIIPKKIFYVGHYENVCDPVLEYVPEDISIPGFMWKFFDEILIKRYCGYNLGQFDFYKEK